MIQFILSVLRPKTLESSLTPSSCPVHQQILLTPPSNYIQNLVSSQRFPDPSPRASQLLPIWSPLITLTLQQSSRCTSKDPFKMKVRHVSSLTPSKSTPPPPPRVKANVLKMPVGLRDLGPLLLQWPHLLPLFSLTCLQPAAVASLLFLRLGNHASSSGPLHCSPAGMLLPRHSSETLLYFFKSVVKTASGLPRSSLLLFLGCVHGCAAIRPLPLTSLQQK